MAEKKPITPEQIGQTLYEKGIQALNESMPPLGFGTLAACTGIGSLAIWKIYNSINKNIKEHYEKNKNRTEVAKINIRTRLDSLDEKAEKKIASLAEDLKSLDAKAEARVSSLAQKLGSDIKHLELKMEIKKLQNKQDQMTSGKYRYRFKPVFQSSNCEKMPQPTVVEADRLGPSNALMDDLYKTHFKDKMTPSEFEQFSQQFISVCKAAAGNDGSLGPKMKELFSKPVVLKLLQLPKKL